MRDLRIGLLTVSLGLLLVCLCGCFNGQDPGSDQNSVKLHRMFDEYEDWFLSRSPEWAAYLGDVSRACQLDDYSLKGVESDHRHLKKNLDKLHEINSAALSEEDRLHYDLFEMHLKSRIEKLKFKGYLRPINQRPDSIHLGLMTLAAQSVFGNENNYQDYISKLSHIPRVINEIIDTMKQGLLESITYPKSALHAVEAQLATMLKDNPADTALFEPFQSMPDHIPVNVRRDFRSKALDVIGEAVIPAFRKLHDFWINQYYPRCVESIAHTSLPNGKDWYDFLLKYYTTTDLGVDHIHQIGLEEVARLRNEMMKIIRETGFKGTFSEFVRFLKTDSRFYYSSKDELLTAYRALSKRIDPELPKIIRTLPRLPYGVRSISSAESSGQAGYCDLGNLMQGRASYLAMTTDNLKAIKKYQMTALILHEMVPGHHLQMSLQMEEKKKPFFCKLDTYHSFVEGWALYSESLGYEMGLYADAYSRFGQLDLNILRAIRLVVDTGIHAKSWSRERAIRYFTENSSFDDQFIRTEVDRYIVYPGQAVSYKIGEQEFIRLRRLAEKELGDQFDIREYHDEVLKNGTIPLSLLARIIEKYIAEKKQI